MDRLFQTVDEDAVKFVVDRRPSKKLLADMHLWNVFKTAAANSAAEMAHRDDEDDDYACIVEADDKLHKQNKKRRHSDDIHDHGLEFSAAAIEISPPLVSSLDKGSKRSMTHDGNGLLQQTKKGKQMENSKNIGEDLDHESVTKVCRERKKKHGTLVDENDRRTEVKSYDRNEPGDSTVVSGSELPSPVDLPHHARKKREKNRRKTSVDVTEGMVDEPTAGTVGKDLGVGQAVAPEVSIHARKKHGKNRHETSVDVTEGTIDEFTAGTAGKDLRMEQAVAPDVSVKVGPTVGDTSDAGVVQSASAVSFECHREAHSVEKSPRVQGSAVQEEQEEGDDDDEATMIVSGCEVTDARHSKTLTAPTCRQSNKVIKSPSNAHKASRVTQALEETVVDSPPPTKDRSSPSPCVVLDSSAVAKKSPKKAGPSNVRMLSSPGDVSTAGLLTDTTTSIPVHYV